MSVYLTLTRRELSAFFLSLSGYVTIAAVVLLMGQSFWGTLVQLQGAATERPVTERVMERSWVEGPRMEEPQMQGRRVEERPLR